MKIDTWAMEQGVQLIARAYAPDLILISAGPTPPPTHLCVIHVHRTVYSHNVLYTYIKRVIDVYTLIISRTYSKQYAQMN